MYFQFIAGVALGLLVLADNVVAQTTSQRPNIIVFVSDDHRADVLGCAGHPIVQTPNIDRLAANGVRFSNAFVTTSICAASRATILTGLVERTHQFTFGQRRCCATTGIERGSWASSASRCRAAGTRSTRCSIPSCRSIARRT